MRLFVVVMFGFVCLCNISLSNQSPAPEYDYDGEYDASSDYDATYDYDQTVDYYDYDPDYDSDQTVDYYDYDSVYDSDHTVDYYDYDSDYDLYDAPAGETCPIPCKRPKSKRCKQRKAAAKCGNQGQNSGGGSKKTCPVKCKRPNSARCKRKNKTAGCNNSGTQTNDPKKPGQPGGETCPIKCKRPNSARCKRKNKDAGCNTNSDPPKIGRPIKPQVPSGDPCDNPCKCSGYTITGPLNLPFGHCQTKDPKNKKFFCYVDSNSACSDKAKSGRSVNLFYSHQACDFERACGFTAADCPESNPNCGDAYDSNDSYTYYI